MVLPSDMVQVEVRAIGPCCDGRDCPVVVIGPRGRYNGAGLALHLDAGVVHALGHELRGEETLRAGAFSLVRRTVEALDGQIGMVVLMLMDPSLLTATLCLEAVDGRYTDVILPPGEALGLAASLGLPIMARPSIFPAYEPEVDLATEIGAFVQTLDLSGLAGLEH